jgi:hypothetical protein
MLRTSGRCNGKQEVRLARKGGRVNIQFLADGL